MRINAVKPLTALVLTTVPPLLESCHTAKTTTAQVASVDMTGRHLDADFVAEFHTDDTIYHCDIDTASGRLVPKSADVRRRHHQRGSQARLSDTTAAVKNTAFLSHEKQDKVTYDTPPTFIANIVAVVVALVAVVMLLRLTKI